MRIKEIDGLRAIAIMAVLWHHYMSWVKYSGAACGWAGVDLFFIISGFLITSILIDLKGRKSGYFKTFYARRSFRIFPPYYLVLIIYFLYSAFIHQIGSLSLWSKYIFYYSSLYLGQPQFDRYNLDMVVVLGLGPLWSLSVEEIFYTLWAPIVRFMSHRQFSWLLSVVIVICPVLRWYFHTPDHLEAFTFYFRMDALGLGALVALIYHDRKKRVEILKRWDKLANILCLVMGITVVLFLLWTSASLSLRSVAVFGVLFADIWFATIMYAVVRYTGGNNIFLRILRCGFLGSIGKVSYSLYLVHYPLLMVSKRIVAHLHMSRRVDAVAATLFGFILSFCAAYLMWYLVEAPSLRLKDALFPSKALEHVVQ